MGMPKVWILKDTTFFAKYKVNNWKVSFDANGGTGAMSPVSQDEGIFMLPECKFTPPAHYHFIGWSFTSDGEVIPAGFIDLTADTTLYAIYSIDTFKISFWANGGIGVKNPIMAPYGEFILPEVPFNNPGKKNVGWSYTPDGECIDTPTIFVNQNLNLYAIYQSIYISFDANGGTGRMATVELQSKDFLLPECKFGPGQPNKEFAGWSYSADGEIITTPSITPKDNLTLYAIWGDMFTVTLLIEDYTGRTKTTIMRHSTGYEYTLPKYSPFSKEDGYVWMGWSYESDGELITAEKITITEDTTIYGVCQVILTLHPNGGQGDPIEHQLPKKSSFELPKEVSFTPPKWRYFDGWSYYPKGDLIEDEKIVIEKKTTLYVIWKSGYDGWIQLFGFDTPTEITDLATVYQEMNNTAVYSMNDKVYFWNNVEIFAHEADPLIEDVEQLPTAAADNKIYHLTTTDTYWHFEYDVISSRGGFPVREDDVSWEEIVFINLDKPRITDNTSEVYFLRDDKRSYYFHYLNKTWEKQNDEVYGLKPTKIIKYNELENEPKSADIVTTMYKVEKTVEGFVHYCWCRLVDNEYHQPTRPRLDQVGYFLIDKDGNCYFGNRPIIDDDYKYVGHFNTNKIYPIYDGPVYQYRNEIKTLTILDDITPIEATHWFESNWYCKYYYNLEKIHLNYCTTMESMFSCNGAVEYLDLTGWDVSNIRSFHFLFTAGKMHPVTTHYKVIDMSTWDTRNVVDTYEMFYNDKTLEHLYIGPKWDMSHVTNDYRPFYGCSKLPNYTSSNVSIKKAYAGPGGYMEYKEPAS